MLKESLIKRLQKLAGIFLKESKNHKNEYGCLMLKIDYDGWSKILDTIDSDDLYTEEEGFGLERKPHVTILFGFHDNTDVNKVKELIKEHCSEPLEIVLNNITMFENIDDKYDVLKFDITCDKLHELNELVREKFDYTSDFPDYHPHCTIAYVKAGTGKKYISKEESKKVLCSNFYYSTKDEEKTYFSV